MPVCPDLNAHESRQLTRLLKSARSVTYMRRSQVVAFSGQGMRVQEIADRLFLHEEYVRELTRRFNRGSFEALRPRQRTGRPSKYSEEEISMILEALTWRPQDVGKDSGSGLCGSCPTSSWKPVSSKR